MYSLIQKSIHNKYIPIIVSSKNIVKTILSEYLTIVKLIHFYKNLSFHKIKCILSMYNLFLIINYAELFNKIMCYCIKLLGTNFDSIYDCILFLINKLYVTDLY